MRRELPAWVCAALMGWLTVVLWLDRAGGGGGLWQQRGLGLLTWGVLLLVLWPGQPDRAGPDGGGRRVRDRGRVRLQPDPRGLHLPLRQRAGLRAARARAGLPLGVRPRATRRSSSGTGGRASPRCSRVGGLWAAYGVLVADRPDVLGAFWYVCLVAVHVLRAVAAGLRGRLRRGGLPGARRHPPGHLGVGHPRPDGSGVDRQPAVGRRGRLRLVRPGRAAGRAATCWRLTRRRRRHPAAEPRPEAADAR